MPTMPAELQENPSGCRNFEPNLFRRERCKHCGHSWQLHAGAISESVVESFAQQRVKAAGSSAAASSEAKAKARAKGEAKRRARHAVEDQWLFDDNAARATTMSSDDSGDSSDESGGFRMFAGRDFVGDGGQRRASSSSAPRHGPVVRNLVDFAECNVASQLRPSPKRVTVDSAVATSSSSVGSSGGGCSSSSADTSSWVACGGGLRATDPPSAPSAGRYGAFNMPMQSKDDVLLEEIQYLRQMLLDAGEEKRIQIAIIRDEMAEKQRMIDRLTSKQGEESFGVRPVRQVYEQGPLAEQQVEELDRRCSELQQKLTTSEQNEMELRRSLRGHEERELNLRSKLAYWENKCQDLQRERKTWQRTVQEMELQSSKLHAQMASREAELQRYQRELAVWEAGDEVVSGLMTEKEVVEWELKLREASHFALGRLGDRRVEIRVGAALAAAQDGVICKICYDRPSSCAFLPCRHHAFCNPCAKRVVQSNDPACPLCRTAVTGVLQTFSG